MAWGFESHLGTNHFNKLQGLFISISNFHNGVTLRCIAKFRLNLLEKSSTRWKQLPHHKNEVGIARVAAIDVHQRLKTSH